jgi:hypothetical protein
MEILEGAVRVCGRGSLRLLAAGDDLLDPWAGTVWMIGLDVPVDELPSATALRSVVESDRDG